jgi:hypothetical protein
VFSLFFDYDYDRQYFRLYIILYQVKQCTFVLSSYRFGGGRRQRVLRAAGRWDEGTSIWILWMDGGSQACQRSRGWTLDDGTVVRWYVSFPSEYIYIYMQTHICVQIIASFISIDKDR